MKYTNSRKILCYKQNYPFFAYLYMSAVSKGGADI